MRAKVLKPFRYSTDGVTAVQLEPGAFDHEIADAMAPGLIAEGFIAEVVPPPIFADPAAPPPPVFVPEATAAITDQPAPAPAQSKRGRK